MSDGQPVQVSLFVYVPNRVAPIVFAVLFAVSAVGHVWQCRRYKCFKLIGLHPVCAAVFALGYVLREVVAFNYVYHKGELLNLILYILTQVFIYICPPLLELANYHVLGRLLHYIPHLAPFPPALVEVIFGGILFLVETLNSLGVSLSANPSSHQATQELGSQLTLAALSIQLAVIAIFVFIAGLFHWRCVKAGIRTRTISTPLVTLYVSMFLILIRCIYRLIEHLGNTAVHLSDPESLKTLSPILRAEWYFYVFEASLMLINSILWNIWNPGRYMPRNSRIYLDRDGTTEVEKPKKPAVKQSLLVKVGNVLSFGLLGLILRFKQVTRDSWELSDHPGSASSHRRLASDPLP